MCAEEQLVAVNAEVTMDDRFDVERILNTAQVYGLALGNRNVASVCLS